MDTLTVPPVDTIERQIVTVPKPDYDANAKSVRMLGVPWNVGNGRPGYSYRLAEDDSSEDYPTIERYDESIFERGAFNAWIEGDAARVRFLFNHGDAQEAWSGSPIGINALPIGHVTQLEDGDGGLLVDATFAGNPLAQHVRELVAVGALNEVSIGFSVTASDIRTGEDGRPRRHVTQAELYDCSIVVWGQYGTDATVVELYTRSGLPAPLTGPDAHLARITSDVTALRHYAATPPTDEANAEALRATASTIRTQSAELASVADAIDPVATDIDAGDVGESAAGEPSEDAEAEARARLMLAEQRERELSI
jgi:HK97 family phage prohead protease